jgi:hypothetical protein
MQQFKQLMIEGTNDDQNVAILNDLSKRIDRGEKMKTLNEKGEETNVC